MTATMSNPEVNVVKPIFQTVKLEPVVSAIVGGGTSAVLLSGNAANLPDGAVLTVPNGSRTA